MTPSLENEFSCAVNFNKETVNTVLNFAQESKVKLMSSQSQNNLKPHTASAFDLIRQSTDINQDKEGIRNLKTAQNQSAALLPQMTMSKNKGIS